MPKWYTARDRYKKAHPACEICGNKKGVECHDVYPYHKIVMPAQWTIVMWLANFFDLCGNCHHYFGHCGDPACDAYNPKVRDIAAAIAKLKKYCTK